LQRPRQLQTPRFVARTDSRTCGNGQLGCAFRSSPRLHRPLVERVAAFVNERIALGKVPEPTLASGSSDLSRPTLGETGGDAVTMSMNLGYLAGTAIFAAIRSSR